MSAHTENMESPAPYTHALLLRVSNNTQSYSKSHHLLKAS